MQRRGSHSSQASGLSGQLYNLGEGRSGTYQELRESNIKRNEAKLLALGLGGSDSGKGGLGKPASTGKEKGKKKVKSDSEEDDDSATSSQEEEESPGEIQISIVSYSFSFFLMQKKSLVAVVVGRKSQMSRKTLGNA